MKGAAFTDVGYQRKINEDSWYLDLSKNIIAVADGMGGHKAGEIASQTVKEYLENNSEIDDKGLSKIFQEINNTIIMAAEENEEYKGMGTTFTLAKIREDKVYIGHIGDSRAYLLRNGKIMQMTTDHTMVNELLKSEGITPEQALDHPYKHVLSRALGVEKNISIEEKVYKLEQGDYLLLSTDGLHGMLSDSEIVKCFIENNYEIQETGKTLMERALDKGGKDNITFIIAGDILENGEQEK
jgi:protein phosphatase